MGFWLYAKVQCERIITGQIFKGLDSLLTHNHHYDIYTKTAYQVMAPNKISLHKSVNNQVSILLVNDIYACTPCNKTQAKTLSINIAQ